MLAKLAHLSSKRPRARHVRSERMLAKLAHLSSKRRIPMQLVDDLHDKGWDNGTFATDEWQEICQASRIKALRSACSKSTTTTSSSHDHSSSPKRPPCKSQNTRNMECRRGGNHLQIHCTNIGDPSACPRCTMCKFTGCNMLHAKLWSTFAVLHWSEILASVGAPRARKVRSERRPAKVAHLSSNRCISMQLQSTCMTKGGIMKRLQRMIGNSAKYTCRV